MSILEVGIGDYKTSSKSEDQIKTYALGSCVAVILYDRALHRGGMIHIALADSSINKAKAEKIPGYFADTGLPLLIDSLEKEGSAKKDLIVKIAGGASVIKGCESFDIGRRNILKVRKILWENRMMIANEDTGGHISRTVTLSLADGKVVLNHGGQKWEI